MTLNKSLTQPKFILGSAKQICLWTGPSCSTELFAVI